MLNRHAIAPGDGQLRSANLEDCTHFRERAGGHSAFPHGGGAVGAGPLTRRLRLPTEPC